MNESKFELLKDLPGIKKGTIDTAENWREYFRIIPSEHPDWFREVKPFKVGDWVITNGYSELYDGKALRITRFYEDRYFYFEPCLADSHNSEIENIVRLATTEEIRCRLDAERIKRGIVKGVKIKCLRGWSEQDNEGGIIKTDAFVYSGGDSFWTNDHRGMDYCVYENGVWAEIIKEEEKIMICGYEVKISDDKTTIHVGCRKYYNGNIENLRQEMEFLKIQSIKIEGVEVSKETIDKIWEKIK